MLLSIFRGVGDFCTNAIFIEEFIQHEIPSEYWKHCIFVVTSPRQLDVNDIPYLQIHFGHYDDYGRVLVKDQFIFRAAHYSSLNVVWLNFQNRFILHVPVHIVLANYKFYLPLWIINVCFFRSFFISVSIKKLVKIINVIKLIIWSS